MRMLELARKVVFDHVRSRVSHMSLNKDKVHAERDKERNVLFFFILNYLQKSFAKGSKRWVT